MQFQNLQVDWQQLPQSASIDLKPIEKTYLKVLYLSWGIFFLLLLVAVVLCVIYIEPRMSLMWQLITYSGYILAVIATYVIITGSFKRKAYAVREKDVIYRTGWIFQKLHIVPFNRVQHCVVQSGPIERKFKLAGISIYTAASNVHDISIKGLKPAEAESLKTFIMQQIQPLN